VRARKILSGLGFADHLVPMDRKTKHMSGGWRMRVSLGKVQTRAPPPRATVRGAGRSV
jgi:ATP-binding cassette subfamily F protein 2